MNIKKILFPTDFSNYNDAALKYASTLAAESGALLTIVHVDERFEVSAAIGEAGFVDGLSYTPDDLQRIRRRLSEVVPTVSTVRYEHRYVEGSPVAEILQLAECEGVDLIVMASHGRTGVSRLLMGSIAEGVMRKAACPVLIVKQPAEVNERADKSGQYVAQS